MIQKATPNFHKMHRVVSPQPQPGAERKSVVFFFYPNYHAKIPLAPASTVDSSETPDEEAEQKPRTQTLSVLHDQARGGSRGEPGGCDPANLSFGAWIEQKWASVQRG